MKTRQQNTTNYPINFLMVDATDHLTGLTGLTPTVTLSKNAAAFGVAVGAVSEIGNGWYSLAGNATDRNTLGELLIHATATGADPIDEKYAISLHDPFSDTVANVTLVATTTTNTDMRGTDGAATAAQVNAEVLDVLTVDTFAQPPQEAPAATTTLMNMLRYLYKGLRNKHTVDKDDALWRLFADDGTTVDQQATISDDGTTFTRGEIEIGV